MTLTSTIVSYMRVAMSSGTPGSSPIKLPSASRTWRMPADAASSRGTATGSRGDPSNCSCLVVTATGCLPGHEIVVQVRSVGSAEERHRALHVAAEAFEVRCHGGLPTLGGGPEHGSTDSGRGRSERAG